MTEEQIIHNLKRLHDVTPDEGYCRRSLSAITQMPQKSPRLELFSFFSLRTALAMASLVLLVVTGGIITFNKTQSPSGIASFNSAALETEERSTDFKIHIREAQYFSDTADRVAMTLDEIAKD